jgi:hypothetical protein
VKELVALLLAGSSALPSQLEFAKYPGEAALAGPPAMVQLTDGKAHLFRTVLRSAAAQEPNFNGHYRATSWGCGTNCIEWAVIDLRNGQVWFAKEPAVSDGRSGSRCVLLRVSCICTSASMVLAKVRERSISAGYTSGGMVDRSCCELSGDPSAAGVGAPPGAPRPSPAPSRWPRCRRRG